ncbi:MAG: hypothetical protein ACI9OJ_004280, partial [Myxococcota bacterium]
PRLGMLTIFVQRLRSCLVRLSRRRGRRGHAHGRKQNPNEYGRQIKEGRQSQMITLSWADRQSFMDARPNASHSLKLLARLWPLPCSR